MESFFLRHQKGKSRSVIYSWFVRPAQQRRGSGKLASAATEGARDLCPSHRGPELSAGVWTRSCKEGGEALLLRNVQLQRVSERLHMFNRKRRWQQHLSDQRHPCHSSSSFESKQTAACPGQASDLVPLRGARTHSHPATRLRAQAGPSTWHQPDGPGMRAESKEGAVHTEGTRGYAPHARWTWRKK